MGNTEVKCEPDREALDGTGEKVCISNVIENITPEQFVEGMRGWLLTRKPDGGMLGTCREIVAREEDGAILNALTYGTPETLVATLGDNRTTVYDKFVFGQDTVQIHFHNYDGTYRKDTLSRISTWKIHRDPFRLEFWISELEARLAGTMLKDLQVGWLTTLGVQCTGEAEQPSVSSPGKFSIILSPISGWDVEQIFEKTKEMSLKNAADTTELPDGSILVELPSPLPTGPSMYDNIILNRDERCLMTKKFLDAELQELKTIIYLKEIPDSPRLECWAENAPCHLAGQNEADYVNDINKRVMDFLSAKSQGEEGQQ